MTAAARLVVTRVPNIAVPRGGVEVATWQRVYESLEITRRNFDAIRDTLNRAIGGGTLIAPGSITLEHLADEAKVILGDVRSEERRVG